MYIYNLPHNNLKLCLKHLFLHSEYNTKLSNLRMIPTQYRTKKYSRAVVGSES